MSRSANGLGVMRPPTLIKRIADLLTQPRERMARGGLRAVQAFRGARDAAFRPQHLERHEEIQVEATQIDIVHGRCGIFVELMVHEREESTRRQNIVGRRTVEVQPFIVDSHDVTPLDVLGVRITVLAANTTPTNTASHSPAFIRRNPPSANRDNSLVASSRIGDVLPAHPTVNTIARRG